MTWVERMQIVTGIVGSLGFSILFNIRGSKLAAIALGSGFGWLLFLILNHVLHSEPLAYFIVASVISLYAEIAARVLKAPTTIFITPSLMPLIPGASLYYTMTYALDRNTDHFVEKAIDTLALASALALGVILSAIVMRLITKIFFTKPIRRQKGE